MDRFDLYKQRAQALLHALDDINERSRSAAADHDKHTPTQVALRLVVSVMTDQAARDKMRDQCIGFASRMADGGARRRALSMFAYVLGDTGQRVLRDGEIAVMREDWERVESFALDCAVDVHILATEAAGEADMSPLTETERRLIEQLIDDTEVMA